MIVERRKFYGLNGVIQEDRERFKHIPLLEFSKEVMNSFSLASTKIRDKDDLEKAVADIYCKWTAGYGYYGDVINVSCFIADDHCYLQVNYIARLAFPKPNMASDLVPIVIDNRGYAFLIAITRKYNPGKGGLALIGGFRSVIKNRMETSVEAAMREASEEAVGLDLEYIVNCHDGIYSNITPQNSQAILVLGLRHEIVGGIWQQVVNLEWLGTYRTAPDRDESYITRQRVDITDAYVLPIRVDRLLTKAEIATWFRPGDDAETVEIIRIDDGYEPAFVFNHHSVIFKEAWKKIANEVAVLYM
ncbi:MAG: hypothetical protein WCO55_04075 [Candidatus Falkowbacteria bacterium]